MVHCGKSTLVSSLCMQYMGRVRHQQAHQQMKQIAFTVLATYLRSSVISILNMNPKYYKYLLCTLATFAKFSLLMCVHNTVSVIKSVFFMPKTDVKSRFTL
jgi:hypothetical protein